MQQNRFKERLDVFYKDLEESAKKLGFDIKYWSYNFPSSHKLILNILKYKENEQSKQLSPECNE